MRYSTILLLVTALLTGGRALAETDVSRLRYDPAAAHAEVDQNDDGQIDHEEFHLRMVEIFFHGDADKDGFMTFEEIQPVVVYPESVRKADRNGDARISLHEFVRSRFQDFEAVDSDDDGLLSAQEVVGAWKRGELR